MAKLLDTFVIALDHTAKMWWLKKNLYNKKVLKISRNDRWKFNEPLGVHNFSHFYYTKYILLLS
jgi:hypothetical protein